MKKRVAGAWIMVIAAGAVLLWANLPQIPLAPDAVADKVMVKKAARRLVLLSRETPLKTYIIALGGNPLGPKREEGDQRTPEGHYTVNGRKVDSGYHRALRISYPSEKEVMDARAAGEKPGGDIMIHGIRNGLGWIGRLHRLFDWTSGCIAVTNPEIEEIWRAVPDGTPIEIVP